MTIEPAHREAATAPALWRWAALALVCAIFFVATGGAFSSLGVMFPSMIEDLSLTYTQAGAAFSVLALMTGLSSVLPAWTLKFGGLSLVYLTGGAILAAGFTLLGLAQNLSTMLIGAGFVGVGYSQAGAVPAVKILSAAFSQKRSLAIGVFFTCGALGSVVGPQIASAYIAYTPSWRGYWMMLAAVILGLCVVAALFMHAKRAVLREDGPGESAGEAHASSHHEKTDISWTVWEALRTPQYAIIIIGVTITLLGALTMNSWQVTHMQNMGVATAVAANALSAHALFNAFSRVLGGAVADKVGAKPLFVSGLAAGVVGMAALSVADTPLLIGLFAFGDGYSFGIVTFASTILLLNYYGARNNPAILGTLNLVTTLAMIGPIAAGNIAERIGGFSQIFMGLAGLMLLCTLAAAFMPRPRYVAHLQDEV